MLFSWVGKMFGPEPKNNQQHLTTFLDLSYSMFLEGFVFGFFNVLLKTFAVHGTWESLDCKQR